MRHGVPTCREPIDPNAFYMRILYRDFFFGPFQNEQEVTNAINVLDAADPYWDYDCFCIIKGSDPLPETYKDLSFVSDEIRRKILSGRVHE